MNSLALDLISSSSSSINTQSSDRIHRVDEIMSIGNGNVPKTSATGTRYDRAIVGHALPQATTLNSESETCREFSSLLLSDMIPQHFLYLLYHVIRTHSEIILIIHDVSTPMGDLA